VSGLHSIGGRAGSAAPGLGAVEAISDYNSAPAALLNSSDRVGVFARVYSFTRSCALYRWRMEAETKLRARSKGGMTDEEVVDFVDRYMPAYKVLHTCFQLYILMLRACWATFQPRRGLLGREPR
jgi:hypothetical protein